jgi:hypothetical protein
MKPKVFGRIRDGTMWSDMRDKRNHKTAECRY